MWSISLLLLQLWNLNMFFFCKYNYEIYISFSFSCEWKSGMDYAWTGRVSVRKHNYKSIFINTYMYALLHHALFIRSITSPYYRLNTSISVPGNMIKKESTVTIFLLANCKCAVVQPTMCISEWHADMICFLLFTNSFDDNFPSSPTKTFFFIYAHCISPKSVIKRGCYFAIECSVIEC